MILRLDLGDKIMLINKKLLKFFSILSLFILIFSTNVFASDSFETIVDNANIIEDKESVESCINTLKENQKIDVFVKTVETSTQEEFENAMNEYEASQKDDFILIYISKEEANVGIFVSDSIKYVVNDANKTVMLKTMESFVSTGSYDKGLIASINNLDKLLEASKTGENFEHETLEIEDKTTQRTFSIVAMGISIVAFIIFGVYFISSILKEREDKKKAPK